MRLGNTKSSDFKDYEFSRATVDQLWQAGRDDVQKVLQHPEACNVSDLGNGVRVFELQHPADDGASS